MPERSYPPENEFLVSPASGEWITCQFGQSNGTSAAVLDEMWASPIWLPAAFTFSSIAITVNTAAASAVIRLGAYSATSENKPGSLLFDAGTVDASTTGVKTITISQNMGPGFFWLVAVPQTALAQWRGFGQNIGPAHALGNSNLVIQTPGNNFYRVTSISGALPSSPSWAFAGNVTQQNQPIVGLVRA